MDLETDSTDARVRYAIANRHLIEFRYGGGMRIAEPHDYGIQRGRARLLVFQLRGPARPGQGAVGWRLLELSKIDALTALDETFAGSRGESHRAHHHWDVLWARVK
jgi:hypothetical protein